MKLKIILMALLVLTGLGSAVNRLPATVFIGDVDMGGNNIYDANYVNSTHGRFGDAAWSELSTASTSTGTESAANSALKYGIMTLVHSSAILTVGDVVCGQYVRQILAEPFIGYGWGQTAWITDRSTNSSGQHVGFYSRVEGNSNGSSQLWGFATEVHDFDGEETSPRTLIGMEILTVKKNATGQSIGMDVRCDGTQLQTAGVRIMATDNGYGGSSNFIDGIHIASGVQTRAINISATTAVGIDTSEGTFYNDAIRMMHDQKLAYVNTGNCYSRYSTESSALEFVFPVANKVIFRTSAGTIVGYVDATGFHNGAP